MLPAVANCMVTLMKRSSSSLSATSCHLLRILAAPSSKVLVILVPMINSHSGWNWNQLYFLGSNDSKTASSTSTNCPKKIFPHGFSVKNSSMNIYYPSINDIVCRKAIFSHHGAIRGAETSWEVVSFAFLSNSIVKLTICGACFNPCATIININTNG